MIILFALLAADISPLTDSAFNVGPKPQHPAISVYCYFVPLPIIDCLDSFVATLLLLASIMIQGMEQLITLCVFMPDEKQEIKPSIRGKRPSHAYNLPQYYQII